ncbi:MAG TPA: alpha/beta hydrolase, partial [Polyangiales bacterium]
LDGEARGSWVHAWEEEARRAERKGDLVTSSNLYGLARFPCADELAKVRAGERAASAYARHLEATGKGQRRVANVGTIGVPFLFAPGPREDAPLVVLMGGIVSLKEQWGSFLSLGPRVGCAVAIADFPGVGENRLRYSRAASALYGAILDAVAERCNVRETLVVAPSFGGHLALLHAPIDARLRKVVTVGAPLSHLFRDEAVHARLPSITRAALVQSARIAPAQLPAHLATLALSEREIADIGVQVTYVAALRDEIIPEIEWRAAAASARSFRVYAFDDVHGAPNHLRETRLIILAELLQTAGRASLARLITRLGRFAFDLRPLPSHPAFV